jgi:hypothetical protein
MRGENNATFANDVFVHLQKPNPHIPKTMNKFCKGTRQEDTGDLQEFINKTIPVAFSLVTQRNAKKLSRSPHTKVTAVSEHNINLNKSIEFLHPLATQPEKGASPL